MREPVPRVSVVMPVYNGGAYLGAAVESLLGQTLSDFELLAVDDGSEDDSLAVLERFRVRDGRVRTMPMQHRGMSAALNSGIQEARSEYVAIANADDLSVPTRLVHQAKYLDGHDRVAVVGGFVQTIDDSGNAGHVLRFPLDALSVRETLKRHNCVAHPSVMFRRSVVEAVGGYRFEFAEDYDLWLRISERFEIANLQEVLVLYRIHPEQVSLSRLGEMEQWRLAVQAAASARTAGRPDPLEGVNEMTAAVLARLGIGERKVARAVRAERLSRAAVLAELDGTQARDLIRKAPDTGGPHATRSLEAARELLRANSCLACRRPLRAALHVGRALVRDPRYSSSRVAAWLGERVRAMLAG